MLAHLGAVAVALPVMEITPPDNLPSPLQLDQASHAHLLIFTSANAVDGVINAGLQPGDLATGLKVIAIGLATQRRLTDSGFSVYPLELSGNNSEQLFDALAKTINHNVRVTIVKGEGGRTYLAQNLTTLGIKVNTLNVYRRSMPEYSSTHLNDTLEKFLPAKKKAICLTSNQGLENFHKLTCQLPDAARLAAVPLIVNSERCVAQARALGYKASIVVARPAGDCGQIKALQSIFADN